MDLHQRLKEEQHEFKSFEVDKDFYQAVGDSFFSFPEALRPSGRSS